MSINIDALKVNGVRAIGNRVLVTDMYFGEQKTRGGLIINDDDGKTRGIYPRWGRVYAKGPENKDDYGIGDWVLVEHGRWTRGIKVETPAEGSFEIRMVEAESILAYSDVKPEGVAFGKEYSDGEHATIDPGSFINV
jgi:co-chaperonin GroES (HSP10)